MKRKVIIVYENINREYDNCLLLKSELERRNYQVILKYKTESIVAIKNADLVITPNCYNIENERYYRYLFAGNKAPLLSLQYEQIFTPETEKKRLCYPDNSVSNVYFSVWGKNYYDKLIQHDIDTSKIKINGSIGLDFCRKEFSSFYIDKNEIGKKYNLDSKKKWILFISSLTLFPSSPYFRHLSIDIRDKDYLASRSKFEVETQEKILEWFDKCLAENSEYLIIYRRHPVEEQTDIYKRLLNKYPNNLVDISDMSVKQWISVCDYCYNWFSTASIEANEFGKVTLLLRPYPIPEERDYNFLKNAKKCSTYDEFVESLKLDIKSNINIIDRSLYINNYSFGIKPAYFYICNFVDDIIDKNCDVNYKFEIFFIFSLIRFYFKKFFILKLAIKKIYQLLYYNFGFAIKNKKIRGKYCISQLEYSVKFHNDNINKNKYYIINNIVNKLS